MVTLLQSTLNTRALPTENLRYIRSDYPGKLADVSLFTFEPHISVSGSKYGYKRENIYYFDKEGLKEL